MRTILKAWDTLEVYWQELAEQDPTHGNDQTLLTLKNPYQRILFEFVDYALGVFNDFNTLCQADAPRFYLLKKEVLEVVKSLCHNFMVKDYVKQIESVQSVNLKREEFFLPASKVYLGPEATARLFSLQGKDTKFTEKCKSIKEIAQKFYIEAVSQLVDQFPFDHDI